MKNFAYGHLIQLFLIVLSALLAKSVTHLVLLVRFKSVAWVRLDSIGQIMQSFDQVKQWKQQVSTGNHVDY